MKAVLIAILTGLAAAPAPMTLARGGYHGPHVYDPATEPCGWAKGALPEPAQTQRCLASRYRPPRPKPAAPDNVAPGGAPPAEGGDAPQR